MGVTRRKLQHLLSKVFGQAMCQRCTIGMKHFANTLNVCRCTGRCARLMASHQHMHL